MLRRRNNAHGLGSDFLIIYLFVICAALQHFHVKKNLSAYIHALPYSHLISSNLIVLRQSTDSTEITTINVDREMFVLSAITKTATEK